MVDNIEGELILTKFPILETVMAFVSLALLAYTVVRLVTGTTESWVVILLCLSLLALLFFVLTGAHFTVSLS